MEGAIQIDLAKLSQRVWGAVGHDVDAGGKVNDGVNAFKGGGPIGAGINVANHHTIDCVSFTGIGTASSPHSMTLCGQSSTKRLTNKTTGSGNQAMHD
jgi:hypothetical protein